MSSLLPTIYSDDEEDEVTSRKSLATKNSKSVQTKTNQFLKAVPPYTLQSSVSTVFKEDKDEDEDDVEMDHDFEFGGILGEDSDAKHNWDDESGRAKAWTFQSALKQISETLDKEEENQPKRTSVASIIAAARKNIQKTIQDKMGGTSTSTRIQDKRQENDTVMDDESHSSDSSSDGDMDSHEEDDTSTDGEEEEHGGVQSMAQDQVRHRAGKSSSSLNNNNTPIDDSMANEMEVEDDSHEDDDDDEEGDVSRQSRKETIQKERERREEAKKAARFFDSTENATYEEDTLHVLLFSQLNLSRPLLRGVAVMGYVKPTPIQVQVIPIVLAGRDVCASAMTGSGKTAAFLLPIMERILQRGGGQGNFIASAGSKRKAITATRALILTPTRELAAQCLGMMTALVQYTHLTSALIVGGSKNVASQATELRNRPDVIIATPGRLLDHITNSHGVDLDDIEFLILDEADRLLDLGFQEEVHEIIKSCPTERQTLLFSATLGTKVDDLIKLSLKRPVRIRVSDKNNQSADGNDTDVEVAHRLEQEFVRIRPGSEGIKREAILLALLTRTYTSRTIVFFDTKSDAHRMMIICGLCGLRCAELHGNLTQVQRLEALESFREGDVTILLATDLAGRGLDIPGVDAVINFEMPTQIESYVHRIGRTARAGKCGKSCTLIGETRRHLMKDVIKDAEHKRKVLSQSSGKDNTLSASTGVIRSRTIPPSVVDHFASKIKSLESHFKEIISAEVVAKMDRITEIEALRAKNIIEHYNDIQSKPAREWHIRKDSKNDTQVQGPSPKLKKHENLSEAGTGTHRMTRKKRRMNELRQQMASEKSTQEHDDDDEAGESKPKPRQPKLMIDTVMKASARAQKREYLEKIHSKEEKSIYEENAEKQRKKKSKVERDSLGSGGLFHEEIIAHERKGKATKEQTTAPSSYAFKGYDANKANVKGKKKSVHSFKSKSKFKRRK